MALIDLKSDLSWYGKTPPGFKPNADKTQTDFRYNDDLTVTAFPAGYSPLGDAVSFPPRTSLDGLPLDNGSATRKAQLGEGTRFPIGPEGQVHQFDIKRTGWYIGRPYSAIYNNRLPFGLAASYTNNSPIDDMYNKFKVRDEAYDPFGYAKPPFILRGIQQDGSSDPQRWGLGGTALANASMEVPRGGIVASVERAALDAVRLGKFLIRPQGLLFLAKQQLLHLMNPNTENVTGYATTPTRQKLFNPVNFLASAVGGIAGLRFKRYGLPFEGDGDTYEGVHREQDLINIARDPNRPFNRLTELNFQRKGGNEALRLLPQWAATSAALGPDSVGGIGITNFTKYELYNTFIRIPGTIGTTRSSEDALFTARNPYAGNGSGGTLTIQQLDTNDHPDATATTQTYSVIPFYVKFPTYLKFSLRTRYEYPIGFGNSLAELTTFKSQLASHEDFIRGIGNQADFDERFKKFNVPYLGTYTPNSPITGDTIAGEDTREDSLESFVSQKTDARKLKDSIVESLSPTFRGGVSQTEDQKIIENRTAPDVIRNYRAMTYGDIQRLSGGTTPRGPQNGTLLDFRNGGAEWDTSAKPTLESFYGYKTYNAANRKRSQPDPINNTPYGTELDNNVKDLIKFRFESVGYSGTNGKPIIFRAYINNLTDQFSPSWNGEQDQGRADPKMLYASFERSIDVSFKVVVHSADEQHNVWDKLSALARNTYPVYGSGNGFHGQFIRVTIGDLYVKQYMYVTSLTYDWDNETPWEITNGVQLPMYTNVDMNLGWVGASKPNAAQIPYSYTGARIPPVFSDTPNNSGREGYQSAADNSDTPAPGDASLNAQ